MAKSRKARKTRRRNRKAEKRGSLARTPRLLRCEQLEDRRLLAIVTVDTPLDVVDFTDGVTSLREAIFATNLVGGADTINFDASLAGETILLTQGELAITDSLTINGLGADLLTIDASGNDPTSEENNGDGSRVFYIDDGQSFTDVDVEIRGLTLTGGDTSGFGGAILSRENLSIADTTISGNFAGSDGGGISASKPTTITSSTVIGNVAGRHGGGIAFTSNFETTQLSISDTTISGNTSLSAGGGIFFSGFKLSIVGSSIEYNTSLSEFSGGGGVFALASYSGGQLLLASSTINNNSASGNGGGVLLGTQAVYDQGPGNFEDGPTFLTEVPEFQEDAIADGDRYLIVNSTISGNTADSEGGGIWIRTAPHTETTIANSTVTGNTSDADSDGNGSGGGVYVSNYGNVAIDHTIVAGNLDNSGVSPDIAGTFDSSFSLFGTGAEFLGPLADNGGPTQTHAMLPGSPAINAGDLNAMAGVNGVPDFDQRGDGFARIFSGRIDIGAYEVQEYSDLNLLVDTLDDESDGDFSRGDLSLREAIELANANPAADTINFDPILAAIAGPLPATILLTMGELAITDSLTINGLGAELLTIDASGNDPTPDSTPLDENFEDDGDGSRIFYLEQGIMFFDAGPSTGSSTAQHENLVTISGLSMAGGDSQGGGAIFSKAESLTLVDVSIRNNNSQGSGGGIYSSGSGPLSIVESSISNNIAFNNGGGIRAIGVDVIVETSTISENTAINGDGGGIQVIAPPLGTLTINSSTISGNSAGDDGGGIKFSSFSNDGEGGPGSFTLTSSTISGNSAGENNSGFEKGLGGGIALSSAGSVTLSHSTIFGNSADFGGGIAGPGYSFAGPIEVNHTIIAGNTAAFEFADLAIGSNGGPFPSSFFFSLIGENTDSNLIEAPIGSPDANGNLIGGPINGIIDPLLAPLADNGGPILTHALLPGSPAIDAGDTVLTFHTPMYDQRGAPFSRVVGTRIDMGAIEQIGVPIIVDTLVDENDGDLSRFDVSLREAIEIANNQEGADTIVFDPSLAGGTILLTMRNLRIFDSVDIQGLGADLLTIDASGSDPTPNSTPLDNDISDDGDGSGIFSISSKRHSPMQQLDVQFSGLTLTGGDGSGAITSGFGDGLFSKSSLSLDGMVIRDNFTRYGGAIQISSFQSEMIIANTIIRDNISTSSGGGIRISDLGGEVTIVDSVVENNRSLLGSGGGVSVSQSGGMLTIRSSTIINNSAPSFGGGGVWISNSRRRPGEINILDSEISGNQASDGGGIFAIGNITIAGTTIVDNSAVGSPGASSHARKGSGGGVFALGGEAIFLESTISENSAGDNGGGIYANGVTTTIVDSTISSNSAGDEGGGIRTLSDTTTISGSTISGNSASDKGGGISASRTASISHSTIVDNTADTGGGLFADVAGIAHTIVAGNQDNNGTPDIAGNFNSSFSLVGIGAEFLGPLADNGGPTLTHALLPGSPAINAGDLNAVAGVDGVPEFDQRGDGFDRIFSGRIDIGAYESQEYSDLNLLVDTLDDESDGDFSRGDLSLREAIELANANPAADTIDFDPILTATAGPLPATILLTMGELAITDSLTINGLGADLLTIDASGNDPTPDENNGDGSRIFKIDDGDFSTNIDVEVRGLTLTGGDILYSGGAIFSYENFLIHDLTISDNSASQFGGGIAASGTIAIEDSIISGNLAGRFGGGISANGESLTITKSTISGNAAVFDGGGILANSTTTISDSTISDNLAGYNGGGIGANRLGGGGPLYIVGSTISGNSSDGNGGGIFTFIEPTISDSTVSGNYSGNDGGGIYARFSISVTGSTITENSANRFGGGIRAASSATITDSTISDNSAISAGGGIRISGGATVTNSTISGNSTTGPGGGIWSQGTTTIAGSTIVENYAGKIAAEIPGNAAAFHGGVDQGGGVWVDGSTSILNSTISGNSTTGDGGGIFARGNTGETTIVGSTISGNSSEKNGGGIWISYRASNYPAPTVSISSSTITGNSADNNGGGVYINMISGSGPSAFAIRHSTVVSNTAGADYSSSGSGGGIFINRETLLLEHSIVAKNLRSSGVGFDITGFLGVSLDVHYSLIGSNSGSGLTEAPVGSPDANGNIIGGPINGIINPLLAPLTDNGGPTQTHALLPGSPAINAGDPALQQGDPGLPEFDQRGAPFARIAGGRIDIGAYEVQPAAGSLSGDFDRDGRTGGLDFLAWQRGFGTPSGASQSDGDGTGDGDVDSNDMSVWEATFGDEPLVLSVQPSALSSQALIAEHTPILRRAQLVDLAMAVAVPAKQDLYDLRSAEVERRELTTRPAQEFRNRSAWRNREREDRRIEHSTGERQTASAETSLAWDADSLKTEDLDALFERLG